MQNRLLKTSIITFVVVGLLCLIIITPIVRHYKDHHKKNYRDDAEKVTKAQKTSVSSSLIVGTLELSSASTLLSTSTSASSTASLSAASSSTASSTSSTVSAIPTPLYAHWIDADTPQEFRTKTSNGQNFTLVFSDEFNTPGRTFAEGKDPKWTAVDLWYWPTGNMEWLSPDAVTTADGSMKIKMTKQEINGKNYRSGMVQSWNKFCFTGGIIEVNVSLPGRGDIAGFWPAVWALGNLGRAGYGATTDGTWPYTYDTCDAAVAFNQSNHNPKYFKYYGEVGQRLNKCVCPGEDHPDPGKGRGAPEIDVLEAAGSYTLHQDGVASLSDQVAPFNYEWESNPKYLWRAQGVRPNPNFIGNRFQQCVTSQTNIPLDAYEGKAFQTYSFEYAPGKEGYILWRINGEPKFRIDAGAIGPDDRNGVAQRLISVEPMYIIMNFGISGGFGPVNEKELPFPSTMWIDYVRVYQRPDEINVTCDPPDFPTAKYINDHMNAYNNTAYRTWAQAGYKAPKYNLDGSCPNANSTI